MERSFMSKQCHEFSKNTNMSFVLRRNTIKKIIKYMDGSLMHHWYNRRNISNIFVNRFNGLGNYLYKKGQIPTKTLTYIYCEIFNMDVGLIKYNVTPPNIDLIILVMSMELTFNIDLIKKYKYFIKKFGNPTTKSFIYALYFQKLDLARYIYNDLENLYLIYNDSKYNIECLNFDIFTCDFNQCNFECMFTRSFIPRIEFDNILMPWIMIDDDEMFCNLFNKIWKPYSEDYGDVINILTISIMLFKNDLIINFLHKHVDLIKDMYNIICKAIVYHNNEIFDWAIELDTNLSMHYTIYYCYAVKHNNDYVINNIKNRYNNAPYEYLSTVEKEASGYHFDIFKLFNHNFSVLDDDNNKLNDVAIKNNYHECNNICKSKSTNKFINHVCNLIKINQQ